MYIRNILKLNRLYLYGVGLFLLILAVFATFTLTGNKPKRIAFTSLKLKQASLLSSRPTHSNYVTATQKQNTATTSNSQPKTSLPATQTTNVAPLRKTNQDISNNSLAVTQVTPTLSSTTPQPQSITLEQQYPDTYPTDTTNSSGEHWGSDYPLDSTIDNWGMYNRESVSYTAWKVNETFGYMPAGWGNAKNWPTDALASGIPVGTIPKVHSVGIESSASYPSVGFSVWVEAVDGNKVTLSSYNSDGKGNYSVETITPTPGQFEYIYFYSGD